MEGRAKYIIVEMSAAGGMVMDTPIIFPIFIIHSDIVRQLDIAPAQVISAGFVRFFQGEKSIEAEAFGESTSLGVKSLPTDSRMLTIAILKL